MRALILALLCGCTLKGPFLGGDTGLDADSVPDADGDGFADQDDCSPDDFEINQGAPELCDGIDNNCDGITDGADAIDAPAWYADADGDGHGGALLGVSCEDPSGSVGSADDCDDANGSVFPGAGEVCDDGVDNDCDGFMGCRWDEQYAAEDVQYKRIDGTQAGGYFGKELAMPGDVDGDGVSDLLGAAPAQINPEGLEDAGAFFLFRGPLSADDATLEDANLSWYGETLWAYIGYSVLSLGDLAGEGVQAVGAGSGFNGYFVVFLDLVDESQGEAALEPDLVLGEYDGDENMGATATGELDMEDDGGLELALGGTEYEDKHGAVWIFTQDADLLFTETARLYGDSANDAVATALAAGDLDGDGRDELLVGAPGRREGGTKAGGVYLVGGERTGTENIADNLLIYVSGESCQAGASIATPDSDGDGYEDLLFGAPGCVSTYPGDGAAFLARGGARATESGGLTVSFEVRGDAREEVGVSVEAGGDMDGDGAEELLIGAPSWSSRGVSGAILLWYGLEEGSYATQDAPAMFTAAASDEKFGYALAGGQDMTGDGLPDFAGGAPGTSSTAGMVRVIPGLSF